jgi:hypothetical protein
LTPEDTFLLENFRQEVGNIYLSLRSKKDRTKTEDEQREDIDLYKNEKSNADSDWHLLQSFCPDLLYEHIRCAISKESRGETHANNQHDENETGAPQILCNYFFGVCMIADISGFTNLSSSLCKKGKSGLDKLHLNTKGFIGQLVDMVYYYGGDGK